MAIDVALILGYDALGSVASSIKAVKAAALVPLVVLNASGADYSAWLPETHILRSRHVNRNHRALAQDIRDHFALTFPGKRVRVAAIVNSQDRMWLCYLDLRRAFPAAAGISPDAVIKTSVKPNLRFLLQGTAFDVPYVLLPKRHMNMGYLLDYPPLRRLSSKAERLITKPVFGASGVGVGHVSGGEGLEKRLLESAWRALKAQTSTYGDRITAPFLDLGGRRASINDYVLIEEYIEGEEYSIEGIATSDGEATCLLEQYKSKQVQEPVFRDLEYLVRRVKPSKAIENTISALLSVVSFTDFPFHIELKGNGPDGLKPVEFNPRPGGGSIADLVEAVHGVDLREQAVKAALSRTAAKPSYVTAVLQPNRHGKVRRYFGFERVQAQPDCVFIRKLLPEGSEIERMDREVYLVEFCVSGKTARGAQRRANELLTWVSVEIE